MEYTGTPLAGLRLADSCGPAAAGCIAHLARLGAEVTPLASGPSSLPALRLLSQVDVWIYSASARPSLRLQAMARRARRRNRQRIDLALRFGAASTDLLLQAAGGMLFLNGAPDEPPIPGCGAPAFDCIAGHAALALLLARRLALQRRHGPRLQLDCRSAVAASIEHLGATYFDAQRVPQRSGQHWSGHFRCAKSSDGHVLLTSQCDLDILADWMAAEGMLPRGPRETNPSALLDAASAWVAQRRADDVERAALERGLPFHRLAEPGELAQHPQLQVRRTPPAPAHADARLPQTGPATIPHHPCSLPLAGVRILDFSWVVAGPLATRLLADAGAEVVRLESPQRLIAATEDTGIPARLNRDKQSLIVDMRSDDGRRLALQLAARCDVLLANFRPRVFAQWGLCETTLRATHPHLITLCMSAFGASGPWNNVPGFAPTLHAAAGYDRTMASADGSPCGWGFSYSDTSSGIAAAAAVVAALLHRDRTGNGDFIDLSQFDHLTRALTATSVGNDPAVTQLHRIYRCADEPHRRLAERWLALDLTGDHRYASLQELVAAADAREPADNRLAAWIRARPAAQVIESLRRLGVPAVIVADAADLCDPASARYLHGYWRTLAEKPSMHVETLPFRIGGRSTRAQQRAPRAGAQTRSVLRKWLELEEATIESLHRRGIVASAAPADEE